MKPKVGQTVHYLSYGTPGGEYASQCRAAIVTEVLPLEGADAAQAEIENWDEDQRCRVSLAVLNPAGLFFDTQLWQDETRTRGGSWHWPEDSTDTSGCPHCGHGGGKLMSTLPRRFHLQRNHDVTGASGAGIVAHGVMWPDGTASVRWCADEDTSAVFWDKGVASAERKHEHDGHTHIVWDDPADEAAPSPDAHLGSSGCPHCPDGHQPPEHGQPWCAEVSPARDGDGQPTTILVRRSAGAHVADSDAEWVRDRLNASQEA